MASVKYELVEEIGVITEGAKSWRRQINLVRLERTRARI